MRFGAAWSGMGGSGRLGAARGGSGQLGGGFGKLLAALGGRRGASVCLRCAHDEEMMNHFR